jgi:hypothetical protein
MAVNRHFPTPLRPGSATPAFELQDMAEGAIVSIAQHNVLAPFDTVYEQGYYGPRRHIYHYDDQGRLVNRSTQVRTTSGWDETARIECSYTASGLLERRTEYDNNYRGYVCQRNEYTYDAEGRGTSSAITWYNPSTGTILGMRRDSTGYDGTGNGILYQTEYWNQGEPVTGWRSEAYTSDSLDRRTSYDRGAEGWIPVDRRSYRELLNTNTEVLEESWNGSRWVNQRYSTWNVFSLPGEAMSESWIWKDKEWIPRSRLIWFPGDVEPTEEYRTEHWNGDCWVAVTRQIDMYEETGQWIYSRFEDWDNGWALRHTGRYEPNPGSFRRSMDSSWSQGSLTSTNVLCMLGSKILDYRYEHWDNGVMVGACTLDQRLTLTGQTAELLSNTWTAGAWEGAYRYIFAHGPDGRVLSLRHEIHTHDGWIPSFRVSRWDSSDAPGTSWDFDGNADPSRAREFIGFSDLTFAYRETSSGIDQDPAPVPKEAILRQNYPNPFNPTTTIPFAVSTGARTTIAIYDVLGREVVRPVDEWKDPGEYKVQFDASALASGMYICRFSSGDVTQTRKLMLVR